MRFRSGEVEGGTSKSESGEGTVPEIAALFSSSSSLFLLGEKNVVREPQLLDLSRASEVAFDGLPLLDFDIIFVAGILSGLANVSFITEFPTGESREVCLPAVFMFKSVLAEHGKAGRGVLF